MPSDLPVHVSRLGPGPRRQLADRLKVLSKSQVFVGIPAENTLRKSDEVNNASLLFILSRGSELNNIPARPVIEPAIEDSKAIIAPELAAAATSILAADPTEAQRHLKLAGMIGANAAKRWFTSPKNGWPPNAPSTIRQKGSKRPMIDTGQLRRSLTYVIAESGSVETADIAHRDEDERQAAVASARAESTIDSDSGEAITLGDVAAAL